MNWDCSCYTRSSQQTTEKVKTDLDPNEDPELAQAILMSLEEQQSSQDELETNIDAIDSLLEATGAMGTKEIDLDTLTDEEMIEYVLKLSLIDYQNK